MVKRDLEEVNSHFNCHQGEIDHLKTREKESKEKVEQLEGFIIRAGHDAKIFKSCLDCMEDNICQCGCTPLEVGEEFVSSEEEARTELSYASARGSEYVAPPVENSIPILVPAPCHLCSLSLVAPTLEEIVEEPAGAICEDQDALLREADVERVRDLQEESSNLVVHSSPRVGSDQWRRLNRMHRMCPGPGQRDQRATRSCLYIQRNPSRCSVKLGVQENQGDKQALYLAPPWEIFFPIFPGELRNYLPATLANLDLQSRERNLSGHLVESWISGFTIHLRIELTGAEGEELTEVMGVDEMEQIQGGD